MLKDFYKIYVISNGVNDFYQTDKITQEDIKNGYRLIKVLFRHSTKTLFTINYKIGCLKDENKARKKLDSFLLSFLDL